VNGSRRPSRSTRRYGRSRGTSSAQPIPRHPVGTTTSRGTASARPIPRHPVSTAHPATPPRHDLSHGTPSVQPIPRHPLGTTYPTAPRQYSPSPGTPSARPIPRHPVSAADPAARRRRGPPGTRLRGCCRTARKSRPASVDAPMRSGAAWQGGHDNDRRSPYRPCRPAIARLTARLTTAANPGRGRRSGSSGAGGRR